MNLVYIQAAMITVTIESISIKKHKNSVKAMNFKLTGLANRAARKAKSYTNLFIAVALLTAFATTSTAQTAPSRMVLGTEYSVADGIDKLAGIDPSTDYVAGGYGQSKPADGDKIMYFYNVGAKRFISLGGYWGTHASLYNTPHSLWLETYPKYTDRFYVNNIVAGSGTGTHIGVTGGGE